MSKISWNQNPTNFTTETNLKKTTKLLPQSPQSYCFKTNRRVREVTDINEGICHLAVMSNAFNMQHAQIDALSPHSIKKDLLLVSVCKYPTEPSKCYLHLTLFSSFNRSS